MKRVLYFLIALAAPLGFAAEPRLPSEFAKEFSDRLCTGKGGNEQLRGLTLGAKLNSIQGSRSTNMIQYASSFLPASSKPPIYSSFLPDKCVPPNNFECDPAKVVFSAAYARWSCMHAVDVVIDPGRWRKIEGRSYPLNYIPERAWCEGVKNSGIGEVLLLPMDELTGRRVVVWGGYAKSEQLFQKNNRPKDVRVFVMQGAEIRDGAEDITVIAEHYVELKDYYGYQPLPVPNYNASTSFRPSAKHFLGIEIDSVYKGTEWDDTCISHVFGLDSSFVIKEWPAEAFKGGNNERVLE